MRCLIVCKQMQSQDCTDVIQLVSTMIPAYAACAGEQHLACLVRRPPERGQNSQGSPGAWHKLTSAVAWLGIQGSVCVAAMRVDAGPRRGAQGGISTGLAKARSFNAMPCPFPRWLIGFLNGP